MPLTEQDHKLIAAYLTGSISDAEIQQVEERRADSEFAQELAFQTDLAQSAKKLGRDALKEHLQNTEKKITTSQPARRIPFRTWWAVAAGIALVAIVYAVVSQQQDSPVQLYAEYFQPVPNLVSPVVKGNDNVQDTFARAFRMYEIGNYVEAARLFAQLNRDDPAIDFYAAVTEMHLERWNPAEEALQRISGDASHQYHQQSQWYLALVHLNQNRISESNTLLEQIVESEGHPFRDEASKLLVRR